MNDMDIKANDVYRTAQNAFPKRVYSKPSVSDINNLTAGSFVIT